MKNTELRIGNYVSSLDGHDIVSEILPNNLIRIEGNPSVFDFGTCLTPIPLTEEWLIKFGFKKLTTCWYRLIVHNIGEHKISIEINENGRLAFSIKTNWVEFVHPNRIKYVHQLQNLVHALTGTELTLK